MENEGRGSRRRAGIGAAAAMVVALVAGCATTPTDPGPEDLQITLAVSGGIAGVDWQVTIDALSGRVVGDRCRENLACDWSDGEVLGSVTGGEARALADEFQRAGFFAGEADYGTECCDQFDYRLFFGENDFDRTVTGSDGRLPVEILELIDRVRGFVSDRRG